MLGLMGIGGFFMFRKFLKVLPKADGKSKHDWQNYWVERSRPLWTDESKAFLDELVRLFRTVPGYRQTLHCAEIGKIAVESGATEVTRDHCIKGYIVATPKRDYKFLMNFLQKKEIDYKPYQHLINNIFWPLL